MKKCLKNLLKMQELTDKSHVLYLCSQKNTSVHDYGSSSAGYLIPLNSKTEAFVSLSANINFIGCWLQAFEHNFLERCNMYFFNMKNMFQKIPVELPKPPSPRDKHQSLLYAIGGGWYMKKLS